MSVRADYKQRFGGSLGYYDPDTFETLQVLKPVVFYDDFIHADTAFLASGSAGEGAVWTKKIVGAAPPTVAVSDDGVNGLVACSLTSASQKQDAVLHMDDQRVFSIAQGAIFEARLALTTLPTLAAVASLGLWGDWADGGSAYRVGFEIPAGGAVTCESDDNVTDTDALAGVTLTAGDYHVFRIDCTNQSDIKFYIDGARVAGGTKFANAANAANSKAQPHLGLYKASGAGVGVMSVDYVRIWQERS